MSVHARSYDWYGVDAPDGSAEPPLAHRSGLEFFRGLVDGSIPPQPITSTIGWTVETADEGFVRLRFEPRPWLFHAAGLLHGGVMATLLDSAMSGAIMTTLDAGQGCTTLQLTVMPLSGVRLDDGPFLIEGTTTSIGRRVGVANGTVRDAAGKLFAQGSVTCLIF